RFGVPPPARRSAPRERGVRHRSQRCPDRPGAQAAAAARPLRPPPVVGAISSRNLTGRSSSVRPAMDFADTPDEAAFRAEVQAWLAEHLTGEFAALGSSGGPADETGWDVRIEWERVLGAHRWVGMSWPEEYGGRALTFAQQVIFEEEYA